MIITKLPVLAIFHLEIVALTKKDELGYSCFATFTTHSPLFFSISETKIHYKYKHCQIVNIKMIKNLQTSTNT